MQPVKNALSVWNDFCAEVLSSRPTSKRMGEDWNGGADQSGFADDAGAQLWSL
jgi:hypothetical protein